MTTYKLITGPNAAYNAGYGVVQVGQTVEIENIDALSPDDAMVRAFLAGRLVVFDPHEVVPKPTRAPSVAKKPTRSPAPAPLAPPAPPMNPKP